MIITTPDSEVRDPSSFVLNQVEVKEVKAWTPVLVTGVNASVWVELAELELPSPKLPLPGF